MRQLNQAGSVKADEFVALVRQFISKQKKMQADAELQQALAVSLAEFRASGSYKTFQQKVSDYGLELHDVERDGNCFFSAVYDQLRQRCPGYFSGLSQRIGIPIDQINQATLRRLAVGGLMLLAEQGDELIRSYADNIQAYIQEAAQDTVWADAMMSSVLCRVLGVTIILLNSDDNDPTVLHGGDQGTLYLGYEVLKHYQSTTGQPNQKMQQYVLQKTADPLPASSAIDSLKAFRVGGEVVLQSGAQQREAYEKAQSEQLPTAQLTGAAAAPALTAQLLKESSAITSLKNLLVALEEAIEACNLSGSGVTYISEMMNLFTDKKSKIEKMLEPKQLKNPHLVEKNITILKHIQSWIDGSQENIRIQGLTADNQKLCQSIFIKVQEALVGVLRYLDKKPVSKLSTASLSYIERQEQKRIMHQQSAMKNNPVFRSFLKRIKTEAISGNHRMPSCFICYAWPDDAFPEEHWMQNFLKQLHVDLTAAGVTVKFDIVSIGYGGDGKAFMKEGIQESEFIILIGSQSMLLKSQHGLAHVVNTELNLVVEKASSEKSKPYPYNYPIIPLLLNGTIQTAFPPAFRGIDIVKRDFERLGYIGTIKNMLLHLYGLAGQARIESQWRELEQAIDADQQLSDLFKPSKASILLGYSKVLRAGKSMSLKDYLNKRGETPQMSFEGGDYQEINLAGGDISGFNFKNAKFNSADLTGVQMQDAELEGANFSHCAGLEADRLAQARFTAIKIEEADSLNHQVMHKAIRIRNASCAASSGYASRSSKQASPLTAHKSQQFIPCFNSGFAKKIPQLVQGVIGLEEKDPPEQDAGKIAQTSGKGNRQTSSKRGRLDILRDLDKALSPQRESLLTDSAQKDSPLLDFPKRSILEGHGGVGKTTLAAWYARQRLKSDETGEDLIIWFKANEPLRQQFIEKSCEIFGITKETQNKPDIVWCFYAALSQFDRWLIVFDDVKDPKNISKFLPRAFGSEDYGDQLLSVSKYSKKGVLITSRYNNWGPESMALPIYVGGFTIKETMLFLRNNLRHKHIEEKDVRLLSDALGAHPYALQQAVNCLCRDITVPDIHAYLKKLEEQPKTVFSDVSSQSACPDDNPSAYVHRNVLNAFAISIDDFILFSESMSSEEDAISPRILKRVATIVIHCMGHMKHGDISLELVSAIIDKAIEFIKASEPEASGFPTALSASLLQGLADYGILRYESTAVDKRYFSLHQLMRRAFHLKKYEQDSNIVHQIILDALNSKFFYDRFMGKDNPNLKPYLNQVSYYLTKQSKPENHGILQSTLLLITALSDYCLYDLRFYAEAIVWFKCSEDLLDSLDNKHQFKSEQSRVYNGSGLICFFSKNPDKAIAYFNKTISLWGDSNDQLSRLYCFYAAAMLGHIAERGRNFQEAKKYFDIASKNLDQYRMEKGETISYKIGSSLFQFALGGFYYRTNDSHKAEPCLRRAYVLMQTCYESDHPELYIIKRTFIDCLRENCKDESIIILKEMIAEYEKRGDDCSINYIDLNYQLFRCYNKLEIYDDLKELKCKIISAIDKNYESFLGQKNIVNKTLWLIICEAGDLDALKTLAKTLEDTAPFPMLDRDAYGNTDLLLASLNGHIAVVQWLITSTNASAFEINQYGMNALLLAAISGNVELVKYLIQVGVPIDNKANNDESAFDAAGIGNHRSLMQFIIEEHPDIYKNDQEDTALILAIRHHWIRVIPWIAETFPLQISQPNKDGETPLSLAIKLELKEVTQFLQPSAGFDASVVLHDGQATPTKRKAGDTGRAAYSSEKSSPSTPSSEGELLAVSSASNQVTGAGHSQAHLFRTPVKALMCKEDDHQDKRSKQFDLRDGEESQGHHSGASQGHH